ncbi:MAG: hypothetical protein U0744_07065 [Gemmataceae bacterium]
MPYLRPAFPQASSANTPKTSRASRRSDYDYDGIREVISRDKIELRPFNGGAYRELLPIDGEPTVGRSWAARRWWSAIAWQGTGRQETVGQGDAVGTTLSFKDRIVSVALSRR